MKEKLTIKKSILIPSIIVAVIVALGLVAFFVMSATVKEVPKGTIAENVYIGDIDVSGMTKKEAEAEIKAKQKEYEKEKIKLSAEGTEVEVTLKELGFKLKDTDKAIKDALAYGKEGFIWTRYMQIKGLDKKAYVIEAKYEINASDTKNTISEKITSLENQAQNATITRQDGKFVITEGKRGKKVELDKAVKEIQAYFDKEWATGEKTTIKLPTILDDPDITTEDLEKITSVLGTFTTTFGALDNRGKNIANATRKINGALLMPGDEFSAEKTMQPFTTAGGYYPGGAFQDGEVIQTIGGGVCQVSTTLYNAVILAELEVIERAPHSMAVGYVPLSQDSAIASGYKDLKFKNNTESPIYVEGYISGGKVTFTIYGEETRPAGRKVSFVSETTSRTPAKVEFVATSAPVGTINKVAEPRDAIKARVWKIVTENGVQVSKEVFNTSNYRSSVGKYEVGIGTDNAEAKTIVQNAIATQNEATIRAAVAQAQAIIANAQKPENPETPPATEPEQNSEVGSNTP